MTLQLMKLNIQVSTTVDTNPVSQKFFHVTTGTTQPGDSLIIEPFQFFDDNGQAVTELPALEAANSYFTVSINGAKQMNGLIVYTPGPGPGTAGSLTIEVPVTDTEPILANTPIVLEVVNFTPTTTTNIAT